MGTNYNYADGEDIPFQAQYVGDGPGDVESDTDGGSNVNIATGNSRVGVQAKNVGGVTVVMKGRHR